MKKSNKNWYYAFIPFVTTIILIILCGSIWDTPQHIVMMLIFGVAGAFALISALLTKLGCIVNPFNKVSEDEIVQRNFSFYDDFFLAILFLLCSASWWLMHPKAVAFYIFVIGFLIRAMYHYYFKKSIKKSP